MIICQHCKRERVAYRRRLCKWCYDDKSVRDLYPIDTPQERAKLRGIDLQGVKRPLPEKPTKFLPGTEGKIRVMSERAERGEELWHPKDNLGVKIENIMNFCLFVGVDERQLEVIQGEIL